MASNLEIHSHISNYLESQRTDILTDEFGYSTYTAPNTMFHISNALPEMMIRMSPRVLKVWLRSISRLRRNHDPVIACTITMSYTYYKDVVSKGSYYKALKELEDEGLLIKTLNKKVFIVNIKHANKLYKPKFEI
jgi:hypothetical protein